MPKFKSVFAGVAVSTALAGGIVSLGAATTATAANAAVAQTTVAGFQTCGGCGGGCGWRRCGCGGGCGRRCSHNRFRLRVITVNNNHNNVRGDNLQAQRQRQFQEDRDFDFNRFDPFTGGGD
ncbi:hypothetical protein ACFYSC_04305 [Streptosporangium sp. NPDC004379]|uniref:hypothetical protein n=1 Tax=Streptosporangium sp. NPDC004379 TaxID=3366189 RepID=UPI0036CD50D0